MLKPRRIGSIVLALAFVLIFLVISGYSEEESGAKFNTYNDPQIGSSWRKPDLEGVDDENIFGYPDDSTKAGEALEMFKTFEELKPIDPDRGLAGFSDYTAYLQEIPLPDGRKVSLSSANPEDAAAIDYYTEERLNADTATYHLAPDQVLPNPTATYHLAPDQTLPKADDLNQINKLFDPIEAFKPLEAEADYPKAYINIKESLGLQLEGRDDTVWLDPLNPEDQTAIDFYKADVKRIADELKDPSGNQRILNDILDQNLKDAGPKFLNKQSPGFEEPLPGFDRDGKIIYAIPIDE